MLVPRVSCTMRCNEPLFPPANYPHIKYTRQTYMLHTSNLSTFPNVLCIFSSPFIFGGNLANLSSFPRYNSFSMWPLKLFENSIQLHRIQNWLKSWRPGRVGEIHIYMIGGRRFLQTDKQDKLSEMHQYEFLSSLKSS